MIPDFNDSGYLPAGIYEASFEEVKVRFGLSKKRQKLLMLMEELLCQCKILNCDILYLDKSSFVAGTDYSGVLSENQRRRSQRNNNA